MRRTRTLVTLTLWNRWVRPRVERTADGTTTTYFGIGKVGWRRESNLRYRGHIGRLEAEE